MYYLEILGILRCSFLVFHRWLPTTKAQNLLTRLRTCSWNPSASRSSPRGDKKRPFLMQIHGFPTLLLVGVELIVVIWFHYFVMAFQANYPFPRGVLWQFQEAFEQKLFLLAVSHRPDRPFRRWRILVHSIWTPPIRALYCTQVSLLIFGRSFDQRMT